MNFPQNASKQLKGIFFKYVAHFVEKKLFYLLFITFDWFQQKHLFKQIIIFLSICSFQTWSEKQISEYFSAHFWDSQFYV